MAGGGRLINDSPFCFSPSLTHSLTSPCCPTVLPSETPQTSSAILLQISPKDLQAGSIHQQELPTPPPSAVNLDSASALSGCLCLSHLLKAGNSITNGTSAIKQKHGSINRVPRETLVTHTILHVPQQSNYLGFVCCELQMPCAARTCTPILPSAAQHTDRGADS